MGEAAAGFEAFVAIVEAGSISAASRESGTPRETLSRQLAQLEERLGVRLLHRQTRALTVTAAGQVLYGQARSVVEAARAAEAAVRLLDEVPRGRLRVTTPPNSGTSSMGEMFAAFMERYPQVELEVFATSRYVDLVAEGVDVALRAGRLQAPHLVTRRLWGSDLLAVASPHYLEVRGMPETTADLAEHDCLLGMSEGVRVMQAWPTRDGGSVPVRGRLSSNDLGLLRLAAEAGQGIALLPRPFVQGGIQSGRLRAVLSGLLGAEISMALVFVERRLMPPRLRAFIDHTTAWFQERDVLPPEPWLRQ